MQVLVCSKPHHLELRNTSRPECATGHAIVRIRRIGICGTDIHAYGGNQPYFQYPRVLGHELAGDVVEVADHQAQHLLGKQVYVIPYLHCGECRACLQHKTNCCQNMQVIGVHQSVVKADITFSDPGFHKKELTLMGSRNATREDFDNVVALMESGDINADAMITHRAPLADVPTQMPQWCDPANQVIKAMISIDAEEAHP